MLKVAQKGNGLKRSSRAGPAAQEYALLTLPGRQQHRRGCELEGHGQRRVEPPNCTMMRGSWGGQWG